MSTARITTISRGEQHAIPIILGLLLAVVLSGCQSMDLRTPPRHSNNDVALAADRTGGGFTDPEHAHRNGSSERGNPLEPVDQPGAASSPEGGAPTAAQGAEQPAEFDITEPPEIDTGATALVDALTESVQRVGGVPTEGLRISAASMRNQSRATSRQYAEMLRDLCQVINDAGLARDFTLTPEPDDTLRYQLVGAAYRVKAWDQAYWELYLEVHDARQGWAVWQSEGPIHFFPDAREGEPRIVWP